MQETRSKDSEKMETLSQQLSDAQQSADKAIATVKTKLQKAELAAQGIEHDDDDHKHETQSKYTIISGMGKAVYVMNLDM